MAAVAASLLNGKAVFNTCAQHDTRISRLLHDLDVCQSKLDQLRDLPEVTALLDCSSSPVNDNNSIGKSNETIFCCGQGDDLSFQNRKRKTDQYKQNAPPAGSTGTQDDRISRTSSKQRSVFPAQRTRSGTTKTDHSRGVSESQAYSTSVPRRAVGDDRHGRFLGQNQHSLQSSHVNKSLTYSTQPFLNVDTVNSIAELRIARVESLSVRGLTSPTVDTASRRVVPVTQPNATADGRDANLPPLRLISAMGTVPNIVLGSVNHAQFPVNTLPTSFVPSVYQDINQMKPFYPDRRSGPMPPLLQHFPSQMNRRWFDNREGQQATFPYAAVPTTLPAVDTLGSSGTTNTQWFGNNCSSTRTCGQRNWRKRSLDESLTQELALKIVSYGSVQVPSNGNEHHVTRQTRPLAKRSNRDRRPTSST